MGRFKSSNTAPEILVRKAIHRAGRRFRLHCKGLPGKPDIVLPRYKMALFVHGCFWHHHDNCHVAKIPRSNPDFWVSKFRVNKERDQRVAAELRRLGWTVEVIWECEAKDPAVLDSVLLERKIVEPSPLGKSR
ncbi:very short patch repair endonuclease [Neorhizobium petrolearium]|uniref:very short patch repair endonuclease n=1 Tax=Neorhizobium petrolearium TaxID=515361 RepID=UPI003F80A442